MADIPVTGVSINPQRVDFEVGDLAELESIINPEDATNKNVTWTNPSGRVVEIISSDNEKCIVKATEVGTTNVRCTTQDGNRVATSYMNVSAKNNYYPLASRNLPNDKKYTSFNDSPRRTTGIRKNSNIELLEPLDFGETLINVITDGTCASSGNFVPSQNIDEQTFNLEIISVGSFGIKYVVMNLHGISHSWYASYILEENINQGDTISPKFIYEVNSSNVLGTLNLIYDGSQGVIEADPTLPNSVLLEKMKRFDGVLVVVSNTIGDTGNIRYRTLNGLKQVPLVESRLT